ncbi:DUF4175 family protein [Hydrocarboniphaga sp.]|uniref:DUF4175 family protein n=1 Tax=Hydrocarboniphaga sp. TaxID=2033016 RepID=UPI002612970C|nr:DUF4175 family protein [Hydrocarboniphaga sp.]
MSDTALESRLNRARRAAVLRAVLIQKALVLPPLAGAVALVSRWSLGAAAVLAAFALIVIAALLWRSLRRYDDAWLARRLNALRADLDDSAELIWDTRAGSTLQQLQRERVRERLAGADLPDLRPPWPRRRLVFCALAGIALGVLALLQPWQGLSLPRSGGVDSSKTPAGIDARLEITPPAYTGVDKSVEHSLEARMPENSRLQWSLGFATQPSAVALIFHDGSRLDLASSSGRWIASKTITASALYRIETKGIAADDTLYRLDAIPDRAPEITVRAPDKTLSVLDAAQPQWQLIFEARDDYGLNQAELSISLAQGSGESIKLTQQTQLLQGEGTARERRYQQTLDLGKLGFAQGDDLIVRLSVTDKRQPEPNRARSASFILRWPPEPSSESAGMEGLVRQTMPAYFRSQRQIVMDTEALIAGRGDLSAQAFEKRSDEIGVDQKLMRLRYGQFLGEEAEGGGGEHHHEDPHAAQSEPGHAEAPGQDRHEHEAVQPGEPKPGSDLEILHEFGHAHDIKEAATLLDDATKALLRTALNEMWDAEGQLRTAQPDAALPHEYRALEAIKQVQQSTRIYLARVGQDLPQVDMTRRLTGERAGLSDPPPPAAAAATPASAPQAAWQALERGQAPDVDALQAWLREHASEAPDSLALIREAERLRRDPACAECRAALGAQLWPLLPPPGTALQPRGLPDAQGASYLQALPAEPVR